MIKAIVTPYSDGAPVPEWIRSTEVFGENQPVENADDIATPLGDSMELARQAGRDPATLEYRIRFEVQRPTMRVRVTPRHLPDEDGSPGQPRPDLGILSTVNVPAELQAYVCETMVGCMDFVKDQGLDPNEMIYEVQVLP